MPGIDTRGNAASATPRHMYARVHALCVGINEYRSSGIGSLRFAESDAVAVADLFRDRFGYSVRLLTGQDATKHAIESALDEYKSTLGADDALVLFFAGHGQTVPNPAFGSSGFLIPYDAALEYSVTSDPLEWERQALSMHELGETAKSMPARHVLILADACFSGYLGMRGNVAYREDLRQIVRRPSRVAITAGREDQKAQEDREFGHGVFTHFLLKELKREQAISATELFEWVRRGVSSHSHGGMVPQYREIVVDNGEFVFLADGLSEDDHRVALARANDRFLDRGGQRTKTDEVIEIYESNGYRNTIDPIAGEREWKARVRRFEGNSSLGDPVAMAALCLCYGRGFGVPQDPATAFSFATEAYNSGEPIGKVALAFCYSDGFGVAKNPMVFERLLRETVDSLDVSKFLLASLLISKSQALGGSLPQEEREQLDNWSRQLAESGRASGLLLRASVLLIGYGGIPTNPSKGVELIRKAARLEMPAAWNVLANLHFSGLPGVLPANPEEAVRLLRKAAERGHANAQAGLGRLLLEEDPIESAMWSTMAWEQGDPNAALTLFGLYAKGSPTKALGYLEKAVGLDLPTAIATLGCLYASGSMYSRDDKKAIELFTRAAIASGAEGPFWLARELGSSKTAQLAGLGIAPPTVLQAHSLFWYVRAHESGDQRARNALRSLRNTLQDRGKLPSVLRQMYSLYPQGKQRLQAAIGG